MKRHAHMGEYFRLALRIMTVPALGRLFSKFANLPVRVRSSECFGNQNGQIILVPLTGTKIARGGVQRVDHVLGRFMPMRS